MKRVAAVVVTYNRKELLKENLDALSEQSIDIDYIVIIDNNSTDGTGEFIKQNYLNKKKFIYKKLPKNVGGAGGFYEGIKFVNEKLDVDFVWLMDDDTIPTITALEKLLDAYEMLPKPVSYLASSVFGMKNEPMNVPNVDEKTDENGYPSWYVNLDKKCVKITNATFVSILVNMQAVKQIGYPVKWYFLWGDDTEYTLRLIKYYGSAYLVGDSKVIHKRKNGKSLSIFNETDKNRIDNYYFYYRNAIFNHKEYFGKRVTYSLIWNWEKNIIKAFIHRESHILKKMYVLHKAVFDAHFNSTEKKAFASRMENK